jgi:hypothetical protein
MKRFTVYRTQISIRDTHNHYQKNLDDEPQFEGVIWTDGTVSLRWLTQCRSWSTWNSIEDMLNVHGHAEYGTVIEWHDGEEPECWTNKIKSFKEKQCQ